MKQRSLLSYSCLSSLSFSLFSPFPPQRWNRNLKKKVSFQCSIGKIHVGQDALFNISFNLVKQSPVSLSTRNFSEGCGQTEKSMSLRMDLGDFSSPWIYLRHWTVLPWWAMYFRPQRLLWEPNCTSCYVSSKSHFTHAPDCTCSQSYFTHVPDMEAWCAAVHGVEKSWR